MGRIKTKTLKAATRDMLEINGQKFSTDFNKNKAAVMECAEISSKKLRNIVAGYAARLKKTEEE
ncbi:30S ribosomal protein S17e [Candidatus Woesearchaeota archaeon]|nr:30S ribosomal protein S17e [Candidatus Woesearchaeota archaeon]